MRELQEELVLIRGRPVWRRLPSQAMSMKISAF